MAAVWVAVGVEPCFGLYLPAQYTSFASHGYVYERHVDWTTPDATQPGRIEFSDTRTFDLLNTNVNPWDQFSNTISMTGFMETFNGARPKIQFMIQNSASGPHNNWPGGSSSPYQWVWGGITYYVAVTPNVGVSAPPPGNVPLRVTAFGSGSATAAGNGSAGSGGSISFWWYRNGATGSLNYGRGWGLDTGSIANGPSSFSLDTQFALPAGTMLQVGMQASGYVQSGVTNYDGQGGSATASGYLDPIIEIDPAWAYADQYHLEYSDGIEQYVPEPASIALLATGAMAVTRRRRETAAGAPCRWSDA